MIDIYQVSATGFGLASSKNVEFKQSIYMFEQDNLSLINLCGLYSCYDKEPELKTGIVSKPTLDWSSCSQTINLNSNTSVYYG